MARRLSLAIVVAALPSACGPGQGTGSERAEFRPEYSGIETVLLDDDLVNLRVAMKGARGREDVDAYARCAAAQYALIRGYGFARHIRTTVAKSGGVWRGDAVYTISATLPRGIRTLDAEVVVRDCGSQGIPTV